MEVVEVKGKDNQTFVVEVNHGLPGPKGNNGEAAGFGVISASAIGLPAGSSPSATVETSGPDTAKNMSFSFGIPSGGGSGSSDTYELTDIYLTTADDIHLKVRYNGEVLANTQLLMEIRCTGPGTEHSAGKYSFTTDSEGNVPSLSDISGISDIYTPYWRNARFSISTLNLNIYATDHVTYLCGTTVTRNTVSSTVSDDTRPVISRAVYNYAENKANKVTSLDSESTDSQYPSAKAVYDTVQNFESSLSQVATSGSYNDLTDRPTIPAPQVQSDWQQTDSTAPDYIKNKPSLPSGQIQSDWNQTNTSEVDYIKNKPSLSGVATSGSYNDLTDKPDLTLKENVSNKVTSISSSSTDSQYPSAKCVFEAIQAGGGGGSEYVNIIPTDARDLTISSISVGQVISYVGIPTGYTSVRIYAPRGKYTVIHNIGSTISMTSLQTSYFNLTSDYMSLSKMSSPATSVVISVIRME